MDAPSLQYARTKDGYSIGFTVCGEGLPLVLMPQPFSHTHHYWRSHNVFHVLYETLARSFRLVCYDSRGMGSSTRGLPDDFALEDFLTDLESVVAALGLERFVLVSQNALCRVAIKYALDHPGNVVAHVLWNPETGDLAINHWEPGQMSTIAETNWDLFVDIIARTGWGSEDREVAKQLIASSITQADWMVRSKAWSRFKMPARLNEIDAPTLILASTDANRPTSSEAASRYIAANIAGARLEILPDPGAGLFNLDPGALTAPTMIRELVRDLVSDDGSQQPSAVLSVREREVLRLIAAGRSNDQIAAELVISANTAKRHVSNIFHKIDAANRAEATAYALRNNLA